MTTTIQTRCPNWCTEHALDDDDSTRTIAHEHEIPTGVPESWVVIEEEIDSEYTDPYISVEVQGGNRWTPAEARRFALVLLRASRVLEPPGSPDFAELDE